MARKNGAGRSVSAESASWALMRLRLFPRREASRDAGHWPGRGGGGGGWGGEEEEGAGRRGGRRFPGAVLRFGRLCDPEIWLHTQNPRRFPGFTVVIVVFSLPGDCRGSESVR